MIFERLKFPKELYEARRKAVQESLEPISVGELRKVAEEHDEEFAANPWQEECLQLMAEQPPPAFFRAVPEANVVVYYCPDADLGIWIKARVGTGKLNDADKRLMKEVIAGPCLRPQTLTGTMRSAGVAVLASLAILVMAACQKKAEAPVIVRPVRSVVIQKREVGDPKVASGHLRARNEVNLAFRIGGRIIETKVGVGDKVQAGQTMAVLDAEVERNTRNSAQADVAAARAALDQSEAFERRQKKLLTDLVISPNEYDTALRQQKTTKAQLDAAEARLKSAEEQLSYTELKSDAAGVITGKGAEVGEVVAAGKMVLQVAQETGRDGVFDVPAQAIRDGLSIGAEGEVWLADHPEIKANGKVREISPQADPVTRNYQVKVELADPPAGMFLGATVLGRLKLKAQSVIEIPSSSLTMIEDKPAVWVIDAKDQRVRRRQITITRHAPDSVIVTDGLEAGERVVTAGVQELHEGQTVKLLGGQS